MENEFHIGDVVMITHFDYDYRNMTPEFRIGLIGTVLDITCSNRKHTKDHNYDYCRLKISFNVPVLNDTKKNKGKNKNVFTLYDSEVSPLVSYYKPFTLDELIDYTNLDYINRLNISDEKKGNDIMENISVNCNGEMPCHNHGIVSPYYVTSGPKITVGDETISKKLNSILNNHTKYFSFAPIQRYYERKVEDLIDKYQKRYENIIGDDSIYKCLNAFKKEIAIKLQKDFPDLDKDKININVDCSPLSETNTKWFEKGSRKALEVMEDDLKDEMTELNNICNDCSALVTICDTYQEKLEVLASYEICIEGKIVTD